MVCNSIFFFFCETIVPMSKPIGIIGEMEINNKEGVHKASEKYGTEKNWKQIVSRYINNYYLKINMKNHKKTRKSKENVRKISK